MRLDYVRLRAGDLRDQIVNQKSPVVVAVKGPGFVGHMILIAGYYPDLDMFRVFDPDYKDCIAPYDTLVTYNGGVWSYSYSGFTPTKSDPGNSA